MRSLVSVTIVGLVGAQQPIFTSGLDLGGPAVYDSAGVYGAPAPVYSAPAPVYSVPAYPPAASAAASIYPFGARVATPFVSGAATPFVSGAATIYPTGPATIYAGTASAVAYPIQAAASYPIQNYIGASTLYTNTFPAPLASATVYPASSYPLASAFPLAASVAASPYVASLPYATTTPYVSQFAAPIVASPYVASPYVSQYSGVVSSIPTMPYATRPYAPAPYVPYQGGVPGIGVQTVEPAGSWGECNRWVMGDDNYDACIRHRGGY